MNASVLNQVNTENNSPNRMKSCLSRIICPGFISLSLFTGADFQQTSCGAERKSHELIDFQSALARLTCACSRFNSSKLISW